MKNRALFGFGRDYHHYVGLGAENLVTGFAVIAYNLHVIESWLRQAAAGAHRSGALELPSARPLVTLPEDVRRRVLGIPEKGTPPKVRGPKGLGLVPGADPPS